MPLVTVYGGTEFGGPTVVYPEEQSPEEPIKPGDDWMWLRFLSLGNFRWIPEGDGTYELQVLVSGRVLPCYCLLPTTRL